MNKNVDTMLFTELQEEAKKLGIRLADQKSEIVLSTFNNNAIIKLQKLKDLIEEILKKDSSANIKIDYENYEEYAEVKIDYYETYSEEQLRKFIKEEYERLKQVKELKKKQKEEKFNREKQEYLRLKAKFEKDEQEYLNSED